GTAPPSVAAVPSITVPVLAAQPVTGARLTVTDEIVGFTTSVAVLAAPLYAAVIVTVVTVVTVLLVITKVAVVAPAATVTEAGTAAALMLLLVSVTTAPPAGAAVASVTVPVLAAPPVTEAGFTVTGVSGGFTTSVTIFEAPL